MERSVKLYSLQYADIKTYLFATLFIVGNILLPQLFHSIPRGGQIWLPIYFFTLLGAYKYGWKVGLIVALLSPLGNYLLFGMPAIVMLPVVLFKSTILALLAGAVAYYKNLSVLALVFVVAMYQVIGALGEWFILEDILLVLRNISNSTPGMCMQIIGCYLFVKYLK